MAVEGTGPTLVGGATCGVEGAVASKGSWGIMGNMGLGRGVLTGRFSKGGEEKVTGGETVAGEAVVAEGEVAAAAGGSTDVGAG